MKPKLNKRNFTPRIMFHDIHALKNRSRIVERLKYSLPGLALVALVVLICWPQAQKWIYGQQPTLAKTNPVPQKNNTATHPEYKGTDGKDQPYTITADYGTEISAEEIELTHPKMIMTLKSGDSLTLKALSGRLNKVTNNINLTGDVTLTHSHGYILETAQAWINCNQGTAYSSNHISGNGPTGIIEAEGFHLTERGNKISFIGGTQLLVHPHGEPKK